MSHEKNYLGAIFFLKLLLQFQFICKELLHLSLIIILCIFTSFILNFIINRHVQRKPSEKRRERVHINQKLKLIFQFLFLHLVVIGHMQPSLNIYKFFDYFVGSKWDWGIFISLLVSHNHYVAFRYMDPLLVLFIFCVL